MNVNMDTLAKAYVRMRDAKRALTKEYDEKIAKIQEQMDVVASAMKSTLQETGGTSLKTGHGTVYLQPKTFYYAQDWALFSEYIVKNNAVELLERRVAQSAMSAWLEANPTNPPPGVASNSEITVVVRKA